jgi:hypothetical protein
MNRPAARCLPRRREYRRALYCRAFPASFIGLLRCARRGVWCMPDLFADALRGKHFPRLRPNRMPRADAFAIARWSVVGGPSTTVLTPHDCRSWFYCRRAAVWAFARLHASPYDVSRWSCTREEAPSVATFVAIVRTCVAHARTFKELSAVRNTHFSIVAPLRRFIDRRLAQFCEK